MNHPTRIDTTIQPTETDGWRSGRPVEDPQKTKHWGFVTAKPSEYLVHVRHGRVLSSSGQGASCFKWPRDAVAVVPTSLQRLGFVADQVTRERVGVEVRGLAVYRIAEPLVAYRLLNFSYPERAQQKLEQTLGAMFVGATRRLVANLSVDECLERRKSALAQELMREVAPVVAGDGRPEDSTDRGWGVVIDTIEIQEVRVLSESVFAAMQAPYRVQIDRAAREAKADAERQLALREAAHHRETREARLEGEAAVRALELEVEHREAEARTTEAVFRRTLERREAEAELEVHAQRLAAAERRSELERFELLASGEHKRQEIGLMLDEGRARAEVEHGLARAERERAEAQARVLVAQNLPELAAAVGQRFGEVKVVQIGDGNAFGSIAQAVRSVVELARNG